MYIILCVYNIICIYIRYIPGSDSVAGGTPTTVLPSSSPFHSSTTEPSDAPVAGASVSATVTSTILPLLY
jgi:hypothetical protein